MIYNGNKLMEPPHWLVGSQGQGRAATAELSAEEVAEVGTGGSSREPKSKGRYTDMKTLWNPEV